MVTFFTFLAHHTRAAALSIYEITFVRLVLSMKIDRWFWQIWEANTAYTLKFNVPMWTFSFRRCTLYIPNTKSQVCSGKTECPPLQLTTFLLYETWKYGCCNFNTWCKILQCLESSTNNANWRIQYTDFDSTCDDVINQYMQISNHLWHKTI